MSRIDYKKFYIACSEGNKTEVENFMLCDGSSLFNINQPEPVSFPLTSLLISILLLLFVSLIKGKTGLRLASEGGHAGIVKILLTSPRIDPNRSFPFYYACKKGHKNVVKLFKRRKLANFEVNAGKKTPFAIACARGHTGVVNLLLKTPKVDINTGDPIRLAVRYGFPNVVEILLQSCMSKLTCNWEVVFMEALNKGDHRTVSNLMLHNIMGPTQTTYTRENKAVLQEVRIDLSRRFFASLLPKINESEDICT